MWLDLAIAMSCGGGGLVCGWIMHAIGGFGNYQLVKQAAASIAKPEVAVDAPTQQRVSQVADRLKAYASSMAADVDAHQTKVQAVNNTLIEGNDTSPEAVVAAVSELIEANQTMQSQLQRAQDRIHEQSAQIESAERRAQTDALTRVPNRGAFDDHVKKQHRLGAGRAGCLALLDVDHFKKFNDVYGHRAGDEVLRVVANMLHARMQSYGIVARYGGEEFALVLDGVPIDQARDLVDAARAAIGEREIQFEDKRLRVTASGGVAELLPGESIEDWLQRADDAMYKSKETGRNCGHWMDKDLPRLIETPSVSTVTDQQVRSTQTPAAANADGEIKPAEAANADANAPVKKADPNAFAYLPDTETLGAAYDEIRGRTQSEVSVFVMAVRCNESVTNQSMRSLLQIVRATMRTVDRIGCGDDSTLLICMPSVDEATAIERGAQVFRSAETLGLGVDRKTGESQVAVGVVEAFPDEEFSDAVSRATQAAIENPEGQLAAS